MSYFAKIIAAGVLLWATAILSPLTVAAGPIQSAVVKSADIKIADVELTDQNGDTVRFGDILRGHAVAVNFIYTSCTTACPIQTAIFAQLQRQLGSELEQKVRLLSISIDPSTDVPSRLKAMAAHLHAKPGWVWLTGTPENIRQLLLGMGVYSADFTQHPAVVLVGHGSCGAWTRYSGFPDIHVLRQRLQELAPGTDAPTTACPD